jgi:hypothetical protein
MKKLGISLLVVVFVLAGADDLLLQLDALRLPPSEHRAHAQHGSC